MDYKKMKKILKEKNDKELREIIKKTKLGNSVVKKNLWKLEEELWKLKNAKQNLETFIRTAKIIRGERKGKDCPALKHLKEYGFREAFECKAREQCTLRRNIEEVYRDFCHSCRLTHKKAKVKMTWKGVFENGKRGERNS